MQYFAPGENRPNVGIPNAGIHVFDDGTDIVTEWSGGISTAKGVFDYGTKSYKDVSLFKKAGFVFVAIGTHVALNNIKHKTEMYQNVVSTYLNLHSTSPENMSGIRVNMTLYQAPYGNTYTKYSFHALYSGAYLGGGSFK